MKPKLLYSILLILTSFCIGSSIAPLSLVLQPNTNSHPDSLYLQARQYFNLNDTTRAFQYLDYALHQYTSLNDTIKQSNTLNQFGYCYYELGNFEQSLHYYQQSLALEKAISDTVTIIGRLRNIGMTYKAMGLPQHAFDQYLEALNLSKELQRPQSIATVSNSIGLLQYELEQYEKAQEYYQVALKEWIYLKDTLRLAFVHNNIGQLYYDQGKYDSALLFYRQALRWKKQINKPRTLPTTLYNLGNTHLSLEQIDSAVNYLQESYTIAHKYDMSQAMASASNSLAELYMTDDRPSLARSYLDTTRILLNQLDSRNIRLDYLRLEALYYEKLAQPATALSYHKQWATLRDSLFNDERLKVIEAQAEYTLQQEAQARENAELRATIAQAKSERQQRYTLVSMLAGGLLSVISVVLFRLYRSNRKMKERNAGLVREVHHRVKNNLHSISSLLSLQSRRLEDENAKKAMNETQLRIQSMALIHRRLYGKQLTEVNMQNYLKELVPQVLDSFGCKAEIHLTLEDIMLDVDQAVPIGLITNEVISNACKYAFPDHPNPGLQVSLQQPSPEAYQLTIHDNGPGFSTEKVQDSRTFGTKLIQLQVAQLSGKSDYSNQSGTLFRLSIPKK